VRNDLPSAGRAEATNVRGCTARTWFARPSYAAIAGTRVGFACSAWKKPSPGHYNVAYYQLLSTADIHASVPDEVDQRNVPLANFERDLLFLLNDVARLLRVDADKRARAHDMTRAQWGILIWLERQPGISQKELAELLEVEPITVARLVDRLERRGMVERRPDPRDRRIWRLHLLLPAHLVLRDINQQRTEMAEMVTRGINEHSQTIMIEALVTMKATLTRDSHSGRRVSEAPQTPRRAPEAREAV
jgi:MarR family transcriptional regulator for hemolysin